jgi:glycosyltransferase involved in cell wall biosynthesis
MRILLVHDYGVLGGGAERVTVDLRDGMRARGHEARLFASTASDFDLANEADVTCYGTNGWPRRLLQVWNPSAVRRLRAELRRFRPDVVHVRMFLTQLSPAILPLLASVPALLHVGNHQTVCPLNTRILPDGSTCHERAGRACHAHGCVSRAGLLRTRVQLSAVRRHVDVFRLVVANSHALARTLSENGIAVTDVIHNGTRDVPARSPLQGPPTVVYAGRLMPLKGVDDLIRAMAVVVGRLPEARLLIVGEGRERSRLESLTREHGLGGSVRFAGHVPRPALDDLVGTGWVQCVPSRYLEPFANVVAEAMMRGSALVATATGGTPELVRDGETGYLVPPGDVEGIADRLLAVLGNRELAERMGAAGRAAAHAGFTTDHMLDRFEAAYARMVQR